MVNIKHGSDRNVSIDRYRGLIIILMVLVNFLYEVEWIPAWMKHAVPPGFTISDLIAPGFLFIIALSFPLSYRKREIKNGRREAIAHAFIRGLAIIGIGYIISSFRTLFVSDDGILTIGVLETIGFTLVLAIPFCKSSILVKTVFAIATGSVHQFLILPANSEVLLVHRYQISGILGPFSLLLFCFIMSDLFFDKNNYKLFPLFSICFIIAGSVLSIWIPFHRFQYSLSFIFISIGINSLLFFIVDLLSKFVWKSPGLLCRWGQNPLIMFILHYLVLLVFLLPSSREWYVNPSPPLLVIQIMFYLGFLHFVMMIMGKKDIQLRI